MSLIDTVEKDFKLEKLRRPVVICGEKIVSHDRTVFNTLEITPLIPVLEPSETTYTNLINSTVCDLVKKFDSLIYDSQTMILGCNEKMLLISVMEDYVFFPRSFEQREYFTYINVVVNKVAGMHEDYVGIEDVMKKLQLWLDTVL
jgi:hypothetical protein